MDGSLSLSLLSASASASASTSSLSLSLHLSPYVYNHNNNNNNLKFRHLSPFHTTNINSPNHAFFNFPLSLSSSSSCQRKRSRPTNFISSCTTSSRKADLDLEESSPSSPASSLSLDDDSLDCVGTGLDVECLVSERTQLDAPLTQLSSTKTATKSLIEAIMETAVLVSPFFFWGTAMVAMKDVLPVTGPFFVASFRLIPAGLLLVAFAAFKGRPLPSGLTAWLSITLFAIVDASCFQRTSAGLGSVIIDSQPLTVAILANLLFGEAIGIVGASGLVLGVIGLLLLEVPAFAFDESNFSLWGSGEWWMLLAAQSMAVGTVMVRWVSKYSDPVMATGWHMVIGGLPLLAISVVNHDPAFSLSIKELTGNDISALLYTSIFGSAISYGVYFYSATKGSLTKLSSFTFLTPMFASIFGFLYLGETFSPLQLVGAVVTVGAIYMVNYRNSNE